jgi:hypothetical protein
MSPGSGTPSPETQPDRRNSSSLRQAVLLASPPAFVSGEEVEHDQPENDGDEDSEAEKDADDCMPGDV